jgi:hypothetical protein
MDIITHHKMLGGKVLSGVFMSYKLKTTLSPYFGYDNFNGANFGMFFRF